MESVPWVPIVAGLLEGFRTLESIDQVQGFAVTRNPGLHCLELASFAPDLALFPCQRREWALIRPYLDVVNGLGSHCRTAALTFDDPYDMETGLAMAQALGFVFTPERLAVDVYEREGIPARHLRPLISTRLHHPESGDPRQKYSADVLQVGGTHWRPRNKILPQIRAWCAKHHKRYGEVAGGKAHGWLVGKTFTKAIHESRVVLEIPRFDLPTQTNPHQVPCTYTGPRVYIIAACGGLPLVIGPRADLDEVFPSAPWCSPSDALEHLAHWCEPEMDARRQKEGAGLWRRFIEYHRPEIGAAQIVRDLELGDPTPLQRVATGPAPFEPPHLGG